MEKVTYKVGDSFICKKLSRILANNFTITAFKNNGFEYYVTRKDGRKIYGGVYTNGIDFDLWTKIEEDNE